MKKSNVEHLGIKIKKIRAFNGMTQDELARAINKTRSMVSHIERTGEVNYYTLKDISNVLKLPINFLEDNKEVNKFDFVSDQQTVGYDTKHSNCLLEKLEKENMFLKEVIQNQWKLIFELNSRF